MRFAFLPAAVLLSCSMLSSGFPALAQGGRHNNSNFYNGASHGVQGGNYGKGRSRASLQQPKPGRHWPGREH